MKIIGALVFATTVAAVFSAALMPGQQLQEESLEKLYHQFEQYLRDRRASYPGAFFAPAPCASAPIPAVGPSFHIAPPHHAPAFAPAIPPYGFSFSSLPQYRDADDDMMGGFSDMDPMQEQAMSQQAMFDQGQFGHMPSARYAYGVGPAAIPVAASAFGGASAASAAAAAAGAAGAAFGINAAQAAAAPAIGVFPNANVGGCSVPLLLSCSPSIRPGHIVKSHGYSYGGESYRGVDEQQQSHNEHEEAPHDLAPAIDAAHTSAPLHQ